jgi:hypothetical protein
VWCLTFSPGGDEPGLVSNRMLTKSINSRPLRAACAMFTLRMTRK